MYVLVKFAKCDSVFDMNTQTGGFGLLLPLSKLIL